MSRYDNTLPTMRTGDLVVRDGRLVATVARDVQLYGDALHIDVQAPLIRRPYGPEGTLNVDDTVKVITLWLAFESQGFQVWQMRAPADLSVSEIVKGTWGYLREIRGPFGPGIHITFEGHPRGAQAVVTGLDPRVTPGMIHDPHFRMDRHAELRIDGDDMSHALRRACNAVASITTDFPGQPRASGHGATTPKGDTP